MKTPLVFGVLAFLCVASPTHAGLDLGWNDCISDEGVSDIDLPCAGFAAAELFGTFQLDNPVPQFIALDISIDIRTSNNPSGDFWNFAGGECNDGNLTLDDARFGDCLSAETTMCFVTGAQCQNGFAWSTGFGGPRDHRIVGSFFRDATNPVALVDRTNYFAFKFSFFTTNAIEGGGGTCVGCTDEAAIYWNSALASGLSTEPGTEAQEEPIEGPGMVGNCAGINGGGGLTDCGCGSFGPLDLVCPVVALSSWGQIKSLYR